eukprot:SAG22_NODE_575_length_8991_cov_12.134859_9_plen_41_part_00
MQSYTITLNDYNLLCGNLSAMLPVLMAKYQFEKIYSIYNK